MNTDLPGKMFFIVLCIRCCQQYSLPW